MPVPEDIRKVPRPKNTVVYDTGHEGAKRYCVRERSGIRYVPGGNPQPRNGKVIGHIYNGVYVPKNSDMAEKGPECLSYGASALVRSVSTDIQNTLLSVYPIDTACAIMTIAMLRVIKPHISNLRLSAEYRRTFVSHFYPGMHLSSNTVGSLLEKIGMDDRKRKDFYRLRTEAMAAEHHIAIDGTLKQDTSRINDLSAYSRKARVRDCKEISVIYAYDVESMEPLCAEVFPGNYIDASAYAAFIRDNDIRKGIIIADKGFPPKKIEKELSERPELHIVTPVKKNDVRIKQLAMLKYTGLLDGIGYDVWYKKSSAGAGRFLYAFRNTDVVAAQEHAYGKKVRKAIKSGKDTDEIDFDEKEQYFGVIVFESDLDIDPAALYRCYQDRWLLELIFKQYKSDIGLNKTRVQSDFSVIGSEFINFIASVLSGRILRKASAAGLLNDMSYADLLDDLSGIWRMTDAPELPKSDDGYWVHPFKFALEELEALGLSVPAAKPEAKKRGRPKKTPASKL